MSNINVVIPMAGLGSRFVKAGYPKPKPFIEVKGKTLIELVLENLRLDGARYFLPARAEHLHSESDAVKRVKDRFDVTFIPVSKLTEGSACTILYAHRFINNSTPLLVANSDQFVENGVAGYIKDAVERELDGSILTFTDPKRDPKWSFAKIGADGMVTEVREKVAISPNATVGIYYYRRGDFFVNAAIDMIVANDRVNNEFYTCPTYNYCISSGQMIGIYNIEYRQMHGLGTPEDLNEFISLDLV